MTKKLIQILLVFILIAIVILIIIGIFIMITLMQETESGIEGFVVTNAIPTEILRVTPSGEIKVFLSQDAEVIKAEVVKWIKSPCKNGCLLCATTWARNEFIKEFFNITDEEFAKEQSSGEMK